MLLGGAINAATAAADHPSLVEAMAAMSRVGRVISPQQERYDFYARKYRVFRRMYDFQMEIKGIMG